MLELTQFKNPLVNFTRGANAKYYKKYPTNLNQTFPMPALPINPPMPIIYKENIKQYTYDFWGRRLYYIQ